MAWLPLCSHSEKCQEFTAVATYNAGKCSDRRDTDERELAGTCWEVRLCESRIMTLRKTYTYAREHVERSWKLAGAIGDLIKRAVRRSFDRSVGRVSYKPAKWQT